MKGLRNILGTALVACVLASGALGAGFVDQRKGEEKKEPPKQEKIVTKEPKQPNRNEQPRNNNQPNRGNDNKKPPF
ncbi:MAG: hypothetical protein LC785_03460 [Acidobacteria bacterium]|nr:hypothetical protein [Acidobacteriota bacterium]MCA1641041.1 hypothetical protein [Acidobacteriota bacterium]